LKLPDAGAAQAAAPHAAPRLIFVSTVYPTPWEPHKGPANRSTVESLRAAGCDVRVVAPVPWPKRFLPRSSVVPVENYPTYWYPPRVLRAQYHRTMDWSIRSTLARAASEFQPDAILAFWIDPDGTAALKEARRIGVPCGIIVGGSDLMLLPADPSRRRVITRTLRDADHLFTVGSVLHDKAIEFGAPPNHVSNFLAGVDLTRFGPGDRAAARVRLGLPLDKRLVLWIGSMVPVKATERLLAATSMLGSGHDDVELLLVGDGPRRAALEQQVAADAALRGRVKFAGATTHATLPDWYRAADLFVLPSRSEGVPNVILESMTTGLPWIASDVGSIKDLLPFGTSSVVPEGDVVALRDAMKKALAALGNVTPRPFDRLDGARQLLHHLGLDSGR
jgi:teichuronic acid biosynthesis glycosyltransferase TuaC